MADIPHHFAQSGNVAGILPLLHQRAQLIAQDAAVVLPCQKAQQRALIDGDLFFRQRLALHGLFLQQEQGRLRRSGSG